MRPTPANVQKLLDALAKVGFGIAKEVQVEEILDRRVFLFADQIRVDVFITPWGLDDFDACWSRRRDTVFDSVLIPVLGLSDLIRSKETDREQDRLDVEALRRLAEPS